MTKKKPPKATVICTVLVLIGVSLILILSTVTACTSLLPRKQASSPTVEEGTTPVNPPPSPDTSPSATAPTDSDSAVYEALVRYLQTEILNLKQEIFITRTEYESRMEALSKALEQALAEAPPSTNGDISVSGTPDTSPEDNTSVFTYSVVNGSITIHTYTGSNLHVVIPSTIGDFPVTRIDENAFRGSAVKTVCLPDTLESIGWFAFSDNPSLTSVIIPGSVTDIGYGAFDNTASLTLIVSAGSYAEAYAQSFAIPFVRSSE